MEIRQFGMGWGALLTATAFLFFLTQGLAAPGAVKGDVFVAGSIGLVVALVAAFILYPTLIVLSSALHDNDGALAPGVFLAKFLDARIWSLGCLTGGGRCGVAWNSLLLAVLTGAGTTAAGPRLRAGRHADRLSRQAPAAGADRAADHHPALRRRARDHPAVRALRHGDPVLGKP